ncbi:MAG: hypothetical protein CNLJKLNK_01103 [Holosporales bacterium]
MKLNILILVALGMSVAQAKFYAGVKTTYSIQKNNHELSNIIDSVQKKDKDRKNLSDEDALNLDIPIGDIDVTTPGKADIQNHQRRFKSKSMNFGVLAGYTFENLHKVYKPYVELDVDLKSQKNSVSNIDLIPDEDQHESTNALNNESFQIKSGPVFGLTLGVEAPITESLSALIGARFNVSRYTATAEHIQNDASQLPANKQQKSAYLFGVEPTLGLKYALNEKIAIRGSVGYNIGQTKGIIKNYVTDFGTMDKRTSAGLTLKPRSLNFSVALIYTF